MQQEPSLEWRRRFLCHQLSNLPPSRERLQLCPSWVDALRLGQARPPCRLQDDCHILVLIHDPGLFSCRGFHARWRSLRGPATSGREEGPGVSSRSRKRMGPLGRFPTAEMSNAIVFQLVATADVHALSRATLDVGTPLAKANAARQGATQGLQHLVAGFPSHLRVLHSHPERHVPLTFGAPDRVCRVHGQVPHQPLDALAGELAVPREV
mmetsp:Transcript_66140/g.167599  ORF Transcript_66140/g.167599 Transcript_66140/m.167599 type:complete len:210 (-) Transcript_66140:1162-1791(-)